MGIFDWFRGFLKGEDKFKFDFVTVPAKDIQPVLNSISRDVVVTEKSYKTVKEVDIERLFDSVDVGKFVKFRGQPYGHGNEAKTLESMIHIMYGNVAVGRTKATVAGKEKTVNFVVTPEKEVKYVDAKVRHLIKSEVKPKSGAI